MQKNVNQNETGWNLLIRIGGIGAFLQLFATLSIMVVIFTLGPRPSSAEEYFLMYQENLFLGLLRDELSSVVLIALYLVSFSGVYAALRNSYRAWAFMATTLTFVAVILCLASHSGLALAHLSDQYSTTSTELQRAQLLTAGEALIASDMWNSTAGFFAGIFLQIGGILASIAMLKHPRFSSVTAWTGIVANGLDMIQHLLSGLHPAVPTIVLMIAGPFYLVWYSSLGRDLYLFSSRPDAGVQRPVG